MLDFLKTKIGVRYIHGKVLFFKATGNPTLNMDEKPSWAVDIREIIAMMFVGTSGLCLILKGNIDEAMILLVGLGGYATGRTVPGGK